MSAGCLSVSYYNEYVVIRLQVPSVSCLYGSSWGCMHSKTPSQVLFFLECKAEPSHRLLQAEPLANCGTPQL